MRRIAVILFALCACVGVARAQAPTPDRPAIYPQLGHSGPVFSVAFSPDRRMLASGSYDKTVKLWDVASGREVRTLIGHSAAVTSVAFSPDGQVLASGSDDKTIKLWDVASGRELRTLTGHSFGVDAVAFSPDGRVLASGSDDKMIKLWDVASGRELRTLAGHSAAVQSVAFTSVAFSVLGQVVASGSADKTVKLWDAASGRELATLDGHTGGVTAVAFSRDGLMLASGSEDKTVKLWDVANQRALGTLVGHSDTVTSVAFSADGRAVAAGSDDKTVRLWDVASGRDLRTLDGHSGAVRSVAISPDGSMLAAGSIDKTIGLWDVAGGRQLRTLVGHAVAVQSVAFSPDGRVLALGSADKTVKLLDLGSGHELRALRGQIVSFAFSPDGRMLASDGADNTIELRDAASGDTLHTFPGHSGPVSAVAFSPDGAVVASGSLDDTVELWNVASGSELRLNAPPTDILLLNPFTEGVHALAFSPDGRVLAAGIGDDMIKLWDVATGTALHPLVERSSAFYCLAFSADSRVLASGSLDGTLTLWDMASGRLLRTLGASSGPGCAIAFSPDGRLLASGGFDGKVTLWDATSWRVLHTLVGHFDAINAVAFSPDSQMLASGSADGTARLWTAASGAQRAALVGFTDGSFLAITPAGYYDASTMQAEQNLNVRVGNSVYPIASYRAKFYRPELVKLGLAGTPLNDFAGIETVKGPPPRVELVGLPTSTSEPTLPITLRVTDAGGGIGRIHLFVNGGVVCCDVGTAPAVGSVTRSFPVQLKSGPNELRAVASDAQYSVQSDPGATATITANLPPAPMGTLHAVVVGIQQFKNDRFDTLKYPVADAQLFADTLNKYSAPLFRKTDITLLTTPADTTRDRVMQALKGMQHAVVGPNDMFVFYAASHGVADNGKYFLITSNVSSADIDRLEADALSDADLSDLLANIPIAQKFVVIDTCHAEALGNALQASKLTGGINAATSAAILSRTLGLNVFSASTTDQEAIDGYQEHGLFTYFVTYGLAGQADLFKTGIVTTKDLENYLDHRVPPLASNLYNHDQTPSVYTSMPVLNLARVGQRPPSP